MSLFEGGDVRCEGSIPEQISNAGDHIRVEMFPNRIEIENPGRFPGLADPSKPLSSPSHYPSADMH